MTTQTRTEIPAHLNGRHERTYEAIFRHPAAHNLEWHDVRSLLDALAEVTEGSNGSLRVTRNGHETILHDPKHKNVTSVEDVLALRRFLEQSGVPAAQPPATAASDLLVVIDHQEAKVYRTLLHGTVPEHLAPYDPHGYGRHLRSRNEETDGKRRPERKSYYEAVAATLRGADRIVLFGSGTGASSALDELVTDLRENHRDVAERVIGTAAVDAHHLTDDQLLARAREFFAPAGV
ncbi:hypothetical protein [Limnoglobus roseus]|uniref:Uncharacterized protein n=1 Tax=Limnoglobus roseus TaxID=2598579 RepID=A0A5C1AC11_9BACT|nr:hypothetical protein [Limnoglobus roseus]QEL16811.1 hypothetical protein PX52LOC_03784 [Limnoglobus roseus]